MQTGNVVLVRHEIRSVKLKSAAGVFVALVLVNFLGFLILFVLKRTGFLNNLLFELLIISSFVTGAIFLLLWKFGRRLPLSIEPKLIMIGVLTFFLLAQGTLLNIDRSRSLYVLSWVHFHEISYVNKKPTLDDVISPEAEVWEAISQRIDEHVSRGLIENKGKKISLTPRGEFYFEVADILADIYSLDGWKQNKY